MAACEKCWGDAYMKSRFHGGFQGEWYNKLLKEREGENQCTPREQAGDYWDEENQCDSRFKEE